jgi:hypothetical protein
LLTGAPLSGAGYSQTALCSFYVLDMGQVCLQPRPNRFSEIDFKICCTHLPGQYGRRIGANVGGKSERPHDIAGHRGLESAIAGEYNHRPGLIFRNPQGFGKGFDVFVILPDGVLELFRVSVDLLSPA